MVGMQRSRAQSRRRFGVAWPARVRPFRLAPGVAACAFLCLSARPARPADFSTGLLSLAGMRRTARRVSRSAFPTSHDVTVGAYTRVEYEPDGRAVTWCDVFVKVLTEAGRKRNRTIVRRYVHPYCTVRFTRVQVVEADGRVRSVDVAGQSRSMADRAPMEKRIYDPNRRRVQVGVPGLEVGDMVRHVTCWELAKPRMPNAWSERRQLQAASPILHATYEVRAPPELPLRSVVVKSECDGGVTFSRFEEDGRIVHRWQARRVPRILNNLHMPPLSAIGQRVVASTIADWGSVAAWYWQLAEPHLEAASEVRREVARLTRGLPGRDERIRAIFDFVSQEIRYLGISREAEAPGCEPHDAGLTLANRHGVCRDKAALLVAMLRHAGIEAYPVLVESRQRLDEEVPLPLFDHIAAAVVNRDGSHTLIDATRDDSRGLFPADLSNRSYLVARPEGDVLRTSPIVPAEQNLMRVETQGRVNAAGRLTAESKIGFHGANDDLCRRRFVTMRPAELRDHFETALQAAAPGARVLSYGLSPEDLADTAAPLVLSLRFVLDGAVILGEGETAVLSVPRLGPGLGVVKHVLARLDRSVLRTRTVPLRTDTACGVRETSRITLDRALRVLEPLPSCPRVDAGTLTWSRAFTREESVLTEESELLLRAVELTPAQCKEVNRALGEVERARRRRVLLRATTARTRASGRATPRASATRGRPSERVILDDLIEYDVDDVHTWTVPRTVKQKVLTPRGKRDCSGRRWDYNPVWDEVELVYGRVTNGDETVSVGPEDIRVMDAAWVSAAPRYPAGKTFVVAFPGVEVGSIVEYQVRARRRDRPFFSMAHVLEELDPVEVVTLRLSVPAGLPLRVLVSEGRRSVLPGATRAPVVRESRRNVGDREILEWTVRGRKGVRREPCQAPFWTFCPCVFVSAGEWPVYAEQVGRALVRGTTRQPRVKSVVRVLRAQSKTERELLTAVRDRVARSVRLAGPRLHELPLGAIGEADRILADGYGNTADRAVVLYAMLREAGFAPELVLGSNSYRPASLLKAFEDCPRPSSLPLALVRVRLDDNDLYLNDTDQHAALGATAHDGRPGLRVAGGELVTIVSAPGLEDRHEIDYEVDVRSDGSARVRKTVRYYGNLFGRKRRLFAEMSPTDRRGYRERQLRQLSRGAEGVGDLETGFSSYPGVESLRAEVPGFAVQDGPLLYLELPESLGGLIRLASSERETPVHWTRPRSIRIDTRVLLPIDYRPEVLPPAFTWSAPAGAGTISVTSRAEDVTTDDGARLCLHTTHTAALLPAVIQPDDYPELLDVRDRLAGAAARTVVLRKEKGR